MILLYPINPRGDCVIQHHVVTRGGRLLLCRVEKDHLVLALFLKANADSVGTLDCLFGAGVHP